jgi:hypothetical protein
MLRFRRPELFLAFAFGVIFIAIWETLLGYQAANCSYQQEYKAKTNPSDSHATADNRGGHGGEQQAHITVNEPFVCSIAGIPTAARQLMNSNEGFFVASFTLALVFVTCWLVWATLKLYEAGERQLRFLRQSSATQSSDMRKSIAAAEGANKLNREIFVASQRPWLKVDVSHVSDFRSNGQTGILELKVIAENIGTIPAVNITCRVFTIPNHVGGAEIDQYRRLSDLMKSNKRDTGFGEVLFPDKTLTFSDGWTTASWHKDNIDAGKAKGVSGAIDTLGFCICVDYMSAAHAEHYQTGYIYLVMRDDNPDRPNVWTGFGLDAGNVMHADLDLMLHPLGSHAI